MTTVFRPFNESDALRSDRSAGDRKRHREKLRKSIRENIADIIAEESIIGRDRDRIIKVPIRGVKEYRFVYGENAGGVGTGNGDTEPGQIVGQAGIRVHLDRRRTVRAKLRRKIASGVAFDAPQVEQADVPEGEEERPRFPFRKEDLTYKRLVLDEREESNAVVICIMDTSGSMDRLKKYLARSFFFLLYQFLCTKYQSVEIVFVAHHTQAKEVSEEEFFHKGESGGTLISSGYKKALEIVEH